MITLTLVTAPIILCIVISFLSTTILYKVVFLALGGFLGMTVGLNYINNLIMDNVNKAKLLRQQSQTSSKEDSKYPTKKVINENYDVLVNVLKQKLKEKKLNRRDILDFKSKLDEHLGEHSTHYSKFNFKNDMHEIYIKLKNNCLTSKDYNELLLLLNSYGQ